MLSERNKDTDVFFLHKNGVQVKVTREEWEKSWIDWYNRSVDSNKSKEQLRD